MAKLSAVELALCMLAMFGRVLDENRMAVHVLLEAIRSYNPLTGQFGKRATKQAGYGGRSSLRAMAGFFGKDYSMKELRTEQGAQAVLHTILDPVIGSLSREDLARLRRDVEEAIRLAGSAPVEEVRSRVREYIGKARSNGRREYWLGVWKKGMGAQQAAVNQDVDTDRVASSAEIPGSESTCHFAVVPIMSTLKRRARVPVSRRSECFPSAVDVCLGRSSFSSSSSSSSPSNDWFTDETRVWHAHGWKMFYPATASNRKRASAMDFKFPPPGTISPATTATAHPIPAVVEQTPEMSAKLKQWEDEWERGQLGTWKAAIRKDNALWFIMECTRDMKLWHPHGWKKFDDTARSAHKATSFRFPAPGCSNTSTTNTPMDSERLDADVDARYRKWEDSWETEQLGKWAAGLKMRAEKGGLWSRLAMAWKSEGAEMWAGMVDETEGMERKSTRLVARVGRLLGLA